MSTPSVARPPHDYVLSSDLARLCLPAEYQDANRRLAWVDSICFLFLLIGLIGFRVPKIEVKPIAPVEQVVPVVFVPQPEQPKPQEAPLEEPPPDTQEIVEAPQVVTVVAANPAEVAFAVPVEGAVMVAPAKYATAPPPTLKVEPPRPTRFDPNAQGSGDYPPPSYPGAALRNRNQGKVVVEIVVEESGAVSSTRVQTTSGFNMLDEAAMKVVKERWRFPPGQKRIYLWECTFRLQ